jgi:TonB family protein
MRLSPTTFTIYVIIALILGATIVANGSDEAEAYLGKVEIRIMAAWKIPPKSNGLKVTLGYHLARNGAVSFVRVERSSGNTSFDDSAIQALRKASPLPPPPKSFGYGDMKMVLEPAPKAGAAAEL